MKTLTNVRKAGLLFQVLDLAPMDDSRDRFRKFADAGDVGQLWAYYEACLRRPRTDESIEQGGGISFRMLRPAMEAIYGLPSK